jgi:hypothetical protein
MNNHVLNYIKRVADWNFRVERFAKRHQGEQIFCFDINSREKDLVRFKRKIWIPWKNRFFRRFPGRAIGVVERQSNGNWHLHLFVVFESEYAPSYVLGDIAGTGRKLWQECNIRTNQLDLNKRGVFLVLETNEETIKGKIRYSSKLWRHKVGRQSFRPKAYGQSGSFAVSHGIKGKAYWRDDELPSNRHSPAVLERKLTQYLHRDWKNGTREALFEF